MNQMRKNGKSIIMISEELMELDWYVRPYRNYERWKNQWSAG